MGDTLAELDATAQAELVRAGDATPAELVDAAIARIEALDGELNAVVTRRFEQARAEAVDPPSGPFRGVPFLTKDLRCGTAGEPQSEGMGFLKAAGWCAPRTADLAHRFRAAGLVNLGRTNSPELGLVPTTEPVAWGATHNPWDPARSPGGSSGGSAAAVAAGLVPCAHASDGGGSIRIPASACGLVGLKTSRGRTPIGPGAGELTGFLSVQFALTRTVRDAAALLDAVAGPAVGDPVVAPAPERSFADAAHTPPAKLRVGVMTEAPGGEHAVHAECIAAVDRTVRLLEGMGHTIEPGHPAALDDPERNRFFGAVWAVNAAGALTAWGDAVGRAVTEDDVEPGTWAMAQAGRGVTAVEYVQAVNRIQEWGRVMAGWWSDHDVLLTPTIAEPPVPLGTFASTRDEPWKGAIRAGAFVPFTPPFNLTGQPAISLPLHQTPDGLPVGVQLVAAYGHEGLLLALAAQLESAAPWAGRRPRLHA